MKLALWKRSWLGAWCLLFLAANATAETALQFPEESIGEVSTRPRSIGGFGYSLDGPGWESWDPLGPARGQVAIPQGHVVRLQLNPVGGRDLSWVETLGADDLAQLEASRTELDDRGLAKLTRLTGLRYLDISSTKVTSSIAESLAAFRELRYLSLSYMPAVNNDLMPAVAAMAKLEQVSVWSTAITDRGLAALAKSRSLRAVYAGRTRITDMGVAALMKMPKIRAVRLNSEPEEFRQEGVYYPELSDKVVKALCGRPELELLDLSGARLSDGGLAQLAASLKRLRRLVLDHTPITREGLLHLSEFGSLENLRCYHQDGGGARFDDAVAQSLVGSRSLKSLRVDLDLTDRGVEALAKMPSLESLSLSGRDVTDASMQRLAAMPSLKKLSLQHTSVTDDGFAAFAYSRTIDRVQITGNRMTTQCVETLATLPNLKQVGLMAVKDRVDGKPTWQGIGGLAWIEQELWICDCPSLTPDDIAAIAGLDRLRNLRIEGGGLLRDSDVLQLAGCERLESLTLTSTVATDRALRVIAGLPRLRSLDLGCVATDAGLHELGKSPSLRRATVASPNMTDGAFDSVRASNVHLESLRRGEFRIANRVVSKSKSGQDAFWRLGTPEERKELNALEGEVAPEIAATHWIGTEETISLDGLRGKVVMIDFWGSWCGPCVGQLPRIRRLRDKYAKRGLVVLGVHSTKGAVEGERYAEANVLDWPIALDDSKQTATAYQVPGWPSLYLIDRRGDVCDSPALCLMISKRRLRCFSTIESSFDIDDPAVECSGQCGVKEGGESAPSPALAPQFSGLRSSLQSGKEPAAKICSQGSQREFTDRGGKPRRRWPKTPTRRGAILR